MFVLFFSCRTLSLLSGRKVCYFRVAISPVIIFNFPFFSFLFLCVSLVLSFGFPYTFNIFHIKDIFILFYVNKWVSFTSNGISEYWCCMIDNLCALCIDTNRSDTHTASRTKNVAPKRKKKNETRENTSNRSNNISYYISFRLLHEKEYLYPLCFV